MFRPNLQNEDHRQAWALLQAVPEGQKSAFLVKAILDSARQDALESTLRRILREELLLISQRRNTLYLGYGKDYRKVDLKGVPIERIILEDPKVYQERAAFHHRPAAWRIGGENAAINPLVIENRLHDLDNDLDRLLTMEGSEIVDLRIKQISDEMLQLRQMKKRAELDAQQNMGRENKAKEIMELISAEDLDLTEYSDTLVYRVIERVTVLSKEEIRIRFVGGFEITQPLH